MSETEKPKSTKFQHGTKSGHPYRAPGTAANGQTYSGRGGSRGRTPGTWPKGSGIPAKGAGRGGPASGVPANPNPSPRAPPLVANDPRSLLRGTPEAMAKAELRRRRRDIAEEVAYEVMLDDENGFARLSAANSIIDRVDGKPVARQEITGKDGVPLIDYRKLPPHVLRIFSEALDKAEAELGHSLIEGVAE